MVGLIGAGSALWTLFSHYSESVLVFAGRTALGSVVLVWAGARRYRVPAPVWWSTLPLTVVLLLSSLGYTRSDVCCEYGYTHEAGFPDGFWNRFEVGGSPAGAKEAAYAASAQVDPFALLVDLAFWWYVVVFVVVSAVVVYGARGDRQGHSRSPTGDVARDTFR